MNNAELTALLLLDATLAANKSGSPASDLEKLGLDPDVVVDLANELEKASDKKNKRRSNVWLAGLSTGLALAQIIEHGSVGRDQ